MRNEIVYEPTGNAERGKIHSYHSKPMPRVLSVGAKKKDVEKLKCVKDTSWAQDGSSYASNYCIGFEVEKTTFHRGAVKEYALFCGFETDSSCGYEAVTNVLPLVPPSYWRNKVFSMFVEAKQILDEEFSPSDSKCGGHISISVDGLTGWEVREKMAKYMGLIYAIYRHRLSNGYCNGNLRMTNEGSSRWVNGNTWRCSHKYQVFNAKDEYAELRIPSRVTSVSQMMRRYELMYEMVDCAMKNSSFKTFLKRAEPILKMMYDYDATKVMKAMDLASHFQAYINKGTYHESIAMFVPVPPPPPTSDDDDDDDNY